jgi:hypothetical protein
LKLGRLKARISKQVRRGRRVSAFDEGQQVEGQTMAAIANLVGPERVREAIDAYLQERAA